MKATATQAHSTAAPDADVRNHAADPRTTEKGTAALCPLPSARVLLDTLAGIKFAYDARDENLEPDDAAIISCHEWLNYSDGVIGVLSAVTTDDAAEALAMLTVAFGLLDIEASDAAPTGAKTGQRLHRNVCTISRLVEQALPALAAAIPARDPALDVVMNHYAGMAILRRIPATAQNPEAHNG